jgi:hypothetical protein
MKMSKIALLIGLLFTAFIGFSVLHNWKNERHSVEFFQEVIREHYENSPAVAQVQVSPAIAWQHTSGAAKFFGFFFLAVMWAGIWFVDQDKHLGKKKTVSDSTKGLNGIALAIVGVPLILSAVFLFSGYSSKFVSNYVEIKKERFDGWVKSGAVEQKGEKTYVDKADSMKTLFNKPFIK